MTPAPRSSVNSATRRMPARIVSAAHRRPSASRRPSQRSTSIRSKKALSEVPPLAIHHAQRSSDTLSHRSATDSLKTATNLSPQVECMPGLNVQRPCRAQEPQHETVLAQEKLADDEILATEFKEVFTLFDITCDGTIASTGTPYPNLLGRAACTSAAEPSTNSKTQKEDQQLKFQIPAPFGDVEAKTQSNQLAQLEGELIRAFNMFDRDGDGFIGASDLQDMMDSIGDGLTDEEVGEILRLVDADGDGQINSAEFVRMMLDW